MDEHMGMIRHHAPRQQFVTLAVMKLHRLLHTFGHACVAEPALADTTVKVGLQLRSSLAGILKPKRRGVTLEQMNDAIRRAGSRA